MQTDAYTGFAPVYDTFMDNVPYEEWGEWLVEKLKAFGIEDGLVLDLGCGTGKMTRYLASRGYDMTGVDQSDEMLGIARSQPDAGILYLEQDMRSFELYGTMRAIVSCCDSLNYILDEADLLQVFRLVNNYLDPGGIFLFDMNTVHKFRDLLGEQTIAENRDDCSFIWDNYYYEEEMVNEYDLTIFVREDGGLFRKYHETHYEKAYTAETICRLLEEAGLKVEAVYDAYTDDAAGPDSERLCFAAREYQKTEAV